jgi:uncharacterized protein YbaR (Trm112 family)
MHILLTDVLACPRCGPEMGLVLLADRMEDRRVVEGRLGCPNCREMYGISGGVADLRAPGAAVTAEHAAASAEGGEEAALRLAALLGLAEAKGMVLVAGPGAALAGRMAALVEGVEVIAVSPVPTPADAPGVSAVAAGAVLPLRDRVLTGAALTGSASVEMVAEALRVLRPGARLVVTEAGEGTAGWLRGAGAGVLLEQDGVVVARAPGQPVQLRLNALR